MGFAVKGEIRGCDLVAVMGDEPPIVVVCELKLSFNLELILQGVERAAICDEVWLAARLSTQGKGREGDTRFRNLCRKLGFGLLGVSANGRVDVLLSPDAPLPKRNLKKRSRIVTEYNKRQGDPTAGGSIRQPIMTAYRQRALACATAMVPGPQRSRDLRKAIPEAPKILQDNFYGWFMRTERGIYDLTDAGRAALLRWPTPSAS